jgi:hypothetical protein
MPLDNSHIFDKFIVNLDGNPKMYLIDLDFQITDDLFTFHSPVIIPMDGSRFENDGHSLYLDILDAATTNKQISLPNLSSKTMVPDIIISKMKFEMEDDGLANFHFSVKHGLRNGLEKQIRNITRPGFYLLSNVLHRQLPWWDQYNISTLALRCGTWQDIKFIGK